MPKDRRRFDRRRAHQPPVRVETDSEGGVRVEADAVTPRELGALELRFEKRMARMEKVILVLIVVTASPKVGGPNLQKLSDTALQGFLQLF